MPGRPARRGRSNQFASFAYLSRTGQFGRFGARHGHQRGRGSRYEEFPIPQPVASMMETRHGPRRQPSRSGLVARAAMRGYIRWVAQSPDTRGLGTGLAALYPAGQLSHQYLAHDTFTLAAFAPPAALAAWVATYKTHGSPRYSGAIAAITTAVPTWLAVAAHTGVTSLPVLLWYSLAASGLWSAYTWSDVLKQRRRTAEVQARWETIAGLAGLEGSTLLATKTTKVGVRFKVDVGVDGPSGARLERGDLAVQIARCYGIGVDQVQVDQEKKNARILWITIRMRDMWTEEVSHPAVAELAPGQVTAAKGSRSILDGPFVLGTDPETGEDLELVLFDQGGARHVEIVASNGGGKSNVLSNIVQQAAECHDVLVVAIDLGKGVIPSLWGAYLHDKAGVGEEATAVEIFEWIDALLDERAIACAGGTHKPSATAPIVIVVVDEQDTASGYNAEVATQIKPVIAEIHKRGRSGGMVMVTAKQRNVAQHTGDKEGSANAYTTIVGRVANTNEMTKALPDWDKRGCPDMTSYGDGSPGVVLLARQGGSWQAGRTRALHDPDTVKALAAAYGPADATLEPHIAAKLPGYADRHPVPAHATANAGGSGAPADTIRAGADSAPADVPVPGGPSGERAPADEDGWGFDTTNQQEVDQAAHGLVEKIDDYISSAATTPDQPTGLDELFAAEHAIDNTAVPDDARKAILQFLADRGPAGARRSELDDLLQRPNKTTARWLGSLRRNNLIVLAGQGPAARYYLPDHDPTKGHGQ
ncbi:winged helix-turn-helix domain-containing protein [Actinomadura oligospora]|uniref:winged helix-turn-helix domain-containing protein n=1 Tax=Actinomadura oligospora TaxID=111804 RepID=UPI00047DEC56|nr:winged helix-turn-helix domain-containing protein [Actinomadura oligospora]